MNANEISPKTNARLQRIKTISRIVRYVVLGFFVVSIGFILVCLLCSFDRPSYLPVPTIGNTVVGLSLDIVLCFWYWNLAKLFWFYERGLIFVAEAIRCIKTLGLLCVIGCLLKSALHILGQLFPPTPPSTLPPGVTVRAITSYGFDFFSFTIAGINVGLLLAGIIIVIIAWIMDEGRKIQEEQELTV